MDYAALRFELLSDPLRLGYAPLIASGADQTLADTLNAPRAGVVAQVVTVPATDVVNCIAPAEYNALTAAGRDYLAFVVSPQTVTVVPGGQVRMGLKALFPAGSTTRANLTALLDRPGSRADQLGLDAVTADHIATALRATL